MQVFAEIKEKDEERFTMKLLTIAIPCYNSEGYMAKCIESLLPGGKDVEILIVDDGSTDQSYAVALEYARRDKRIHLLQQVNQGSAAARNNGLRHASGRYIALLDADDLWHPTFLEAQLTFMRQKRATLVCSAYKRIDESGKEILCPLFPPEQIHYDDLLKTNSIACLTALYDTRPYGIFFLDEQFRSLRDDYLLWLTILKKCHTAYGNPQVLASYRLSSQGVTANKWRMIVPQYRVYHQAEKMSSLKSLFYLSCWALNGIKKYV